MTLADLAPAPVEPGELLERLRGVIDPELGVNIVDLGLVYEAEMVDGIADILITTTTPACPLGPYLGNQIKWALLAIDSVLGVRVRLTHEPRWGPEMMNEAAKAQLGWAR